MFLSVAWSSAFLSTSDKADSNCLRTGTELLKRAEVMDVFAREGRHGMRLRVEED